MRIGRGKHSGTSSGQLGHGRLGREQHDRACGEGDAALVRTLGVRVDDRRRDPGRGAPPLRDRCRHGREPAAMVEAPMGEEHDLDRREVHPEPLGVAQPQ